MTRNFFPWKVPFLLAAASLLGTPGAAQESGAKQHAEHQAHEQPAESLADQLAALQEKVARLEAALKREHRDATPQTSGQMGTGKMMGGMGAGQMGMGMMGGMGSGQTGMGKMMGGMGSGQTGMGKMMGGMGSGQMGMGMMGGMGSGQMGLGNMMGRMGAGQMGMNAASASALPGFPGITHVYHVGETGFFLDHADHLGLETEQRKALAAIAQRTTLDQATHQRKVEQAEQDLWELTSEDAPDAAKVEAKLQEIARLQVERRLDFIRAVGEAARILTDVQRRMLVGESPPHSTGAHQEENGSNSSRPHY